MTVQFDEDMVIKSRKEEFLSNEVNKQKFINLLSEKLEAAGCCTRHAREDADLLIVMTTVEYAQSTDTILIGDDTDLLVLLIYHADLNGNGIFFVPEPKMSMGKKRTWDIKTLKRCLGPNVCHNIFCSTNFVHALLGCDTTSRVYGLGKGLGLKKLKADATFCEQAELFNNMKPDNKSAKTAIINSGERALVALYKGNPGDTLDLLRHRNFCTKVASSLVKVEPKSLPPTSASAKYHSLRVYYQVQEWRGQAMHMSPEDWGWQLLDGKYFPRLIDQKPAPKDLMQVIKCACKKDCSTRRCSCRDSGTECTVVCLVCRGASCSNSPRPTLDQEAGDDFFI